MRTGKRKKHGRIIYYSIIVFLSIGIFFYFQFFGPISINLKINDIKDIQFEVLDGQAATILVESNQKDDVIEDLKKVKLNKTTFKCNCRGTVMVTIDYNNGEAVQFDGFYMKKTNKSGKVTNYTLRPVDKKIGIIYEDYLSRIVNPIE